MCHGLGRDCLHNICWGLDMRKPPHIPVDMMHHDRTAKPVQQTDMTMWPATVPMQEQGPAGMVPTWSGPPKP